MTGVALIGGTGCLVTAPAIVRVTPHGGAYLRFMSSAEAVGSGDPFAI